MLEIIINKSKEQKEIALVENGKLVEYYLDLIRKIQLS